MAMKIHDNISMSLAKPDDLVLSLKLKWATGAASIGLGLLILALANIQLPQSNIILIISMLLLSFGVILFSHALYRNHISSNKNNGIWYNSITSRGLQGWMLGLVLTSFYIVLYFYPNLLGLGLNGQGNTGLIHLFDALSLNLNGHNATQWFVYGTLYTLAILLFGYKFMLKYQKNRYQQLRTLSVMFFQLGFAFLIPELMSKLNSESSQLPYYDLKNIWPLNYAQFEQGRVDGFLNGSSLGMLLLAFSILSVFVISPILTYKYGKRWYCSWVCGCGGLAETAGDSFRHLSSKTLKSWKVERWLIHVVLVFVILMTVAVISTYLETDALQYWLTRDAFLVLIGALLTAVFSLTMIFKRKELAQDAQYAAIGFFVLILSLLGFHFFSIGSELFFIDAETLRSSYGFFIGSIFSGVIGVGMYPILGSRVWCRFGCPMAAVLGFQQRLFSKFRITTNGGQCISCGNCSTFCEMGIDVRAYAQKGENIVRSSCVGCGICADVCPRGVLKLENVSIIEGLNFPKIRKETKE